MMTPRPRVLLLTAACLFGGTRLHAAQPPAPEAGSATAPAATPPPSSPPAAEPPKPAPAPAAAEPAKPPAPAQAKPEPEPTPPAPVQKIAAGGILGRTVVGPDNQAIGQVVDVLVDAGSNPRAAVIDFGGFMGVGSRRIAINWSDLSFPPVSANGTNSNIKLDLSAEQIMTAPEYTDQTKPAAVVEPPEALSKLAKPEGAPGH